MSLHLSVKPTVVSHDDEINIVPMPARTLDVSRMFPGSRLRVLCHEEGVRNSELPSRAQLQEPNAVFVRVATPVFSDDVFPNDVVGSTLALNSLKYE